MIPGPQNHKTITDYLFLFVSYDNMILIKQQKGKTKLLAWDQTPHWKKKNRTAISFSIHCIKRNTWRLFYVFI